MFLIDTDVLSALRKRKRHPEIAQWIEKQRSADLYLSVVSVGEIERGIERQQRRDPVHAHALAAWLDSVLALYGERILAVDLSAARRWGRLSGVLGHEGADLLITATVPRTPLSWTTTRGFVYRAQPRTLLQQSVPLPGRRCRPPDRAVDRAACSSATAAEDWTRSGVRSPY